MSYNITYTDIEERYAVTTNTINFQRGFTGHEHWNELGLIDMNGRFYDPLLARFLSPDPYVQAPDNSQNFNRYSYCLNNPLKYTDPSGEFISGIVLGAIIGAVVGTYTGGSIANGSYNPAKWDYGSGRTWGLMFGGSVIGAASGVVGAYVGQATAATYGVASFESGFTSGALGGAVGGAISGSGNAWMSGKSFEIGLLAGIQGAEISATIGGTIGGAIGGITAYNHGGNFWNGDGSTYVLTSTETSNLKPADVTVGKDVVYSNEGLNDYANALYGDLDYVNNLSIDGTLPKEFHWENGCIVKDNGRIVNGITYGVGKGKSNVIIGKSAFINSTKLSITIGHEYIHATHNYMYSIGAIKNINALYRGMKGYLMTEMSAYNWEASVGIKNGYAKFINYLGDFSWKRAPYFNWLKR